MHVAEEASAIVGGTSAFEFQLTVPGAIVPAAGVTIVGVLPTHTRRGILKQLMRAQLDDVHERGEPVACLWASEGTIYGRFGYGLAAMCGDIDIERVYGGFRRVPEHGGTLRLLSHEEALEAIPPVYARVAAGTARDVRPLARVVGGAGAARLGGASRRRRRDGARRPRARTARGWPTPSTG